MSLAKHVPFLVLVFSASNCAFHQSENDREPSSLRAPLRAPRSCAPTSGRIAPEDNAKVFSEWGHLINSVPGVDEFIRIVKNKKDSGYALWYCEGRAPGDGNYNKIPCWSLSPQLFDAKADDAHLKNCQLFEKLRNNGFGLPSDTSIKFKLIKGPYPVAFAVPQMDTERFCAGAFDAFERCLDRRR